MCTKILRKNLFFCVFYLQKTVFLDCSQAVFLQNFTVFRAPTLFLELWHKLKGVLEHFLFYLFLAQQRLENSYRPVQGWKTRFDMAFISEKNVKKHQNMSFSFFLKKWKKQALE